MAGPGTFPTALGGTRHACTQIGHERDVCRSVGARGVGRGIGGGAELGRHGAAQHDTRATSTSGQLWRWSVRRHPRPMRMTTRAAALLCVGALLTGACTAEPDPKVASSATPAVQPEPEPEVQPEPEPEPTEEPREPLDPVGDPLDLDRVDVQLLTVDEGVLFGRELRDIQPEQGERAVQIAERLIADHLDAAWFDAETRFTDAAAAALLSPRALEVMDSDTAAALGALDLEPEQVSATASRIGHIVLGVDDRVDSVTASWTMTAQLTSDTDETSTLRSDGAAVLVPREDGWEAIAAEATTALDGQVLATGRVREPFTDDGGIVTFGVLGSDEGPPHRPGDPTRGRADGIHVVALDESTGRATIASIPRDTVHKGGRLNRFMALQGPAVMADELGQFAGLELDHWLMTTFQGVIGMVNSVGPVATEITVPMRDRAAQTDFDVGWRDLGGIGALAFLRDRNSVPGGDFGRSANHGRFMGFAAAHMSEREPGLRDATRLAASISRHTITDIPPSQTMPMVLLALELDPAALRLDPVGGGTGNIGGASVVIAAPGDIFGRIARGEVGVDPPDPAPEADDDAEG